MSYYLNFPDFRHFSQVKFSVNARRKKEEGKFINQNPEISLLIAILVFLIFDIFYK
ncbi:hypothetical protein [Okeania sp. SIO1I7]|uniref:hypothetical protein n=1 Tax=Okeania sp. SIO1I7 TaxID=2607772 RepID=UPI0013FB2B7B|nr:hypothetical protein [Okeania sp. SIO1I7]NET24043.1 hypothetical protein [Okeania sp. SIO1I7]